MGPFFEHELKTDIGDGPYSILIDDSTDISVNKYTWVLLSFTSVLLKTKLFIHF